MEGLIALIVIIAAFVRMNENMKKVKQNAPGRSGAPVMPAESVKPAAAPARPVVMQPTIQPTVKPAEPSKSFWEQMLDALEENDVPAKNENVSPKQTAAPKKQQSHAAVGSLTEGSSRECEHGSLGGSMPYTHSDDSSVMQREIVRQDEQSASSVYSPAMDAEEMRRAVVMAEILKRPQERMAEQARRWTLR